MKSLLGKIAQFFLPTYGYQTPSAPGIIDEELMSYIVPHLDRENMLINNTQRAEWQHSESRRNMPTAYQFVVKNIR